MVITQERLRELFDYDPETGILTRLLPMGSRGRVGDSVGSKTEAGYLETSVEGHRLYVHRIIYCWKEGYWPEHQIDHKKGVRDDNRWSEIRHATQFCNQHNCIVSRNNTSGFPGVSWCSKDRTFVVQVGFNRSNIRIGSNRDVLEAALMRYTWEVWCKDWTCNHRSELVKAIKVIWEEFKP